MAARDSQQHRARPKIGSQVVPHSWGIPDWPEHVYPGSADRARYFVREHRLALLEAGAIVRIGRQLVVLGEPFERWMKRQARRVPAYTIAPNRPTHDEADTCSA